GVNTVTVRSTISGYRSYLVSDLHGDVHRYRALFRLLRDEPPDLLFMAGDLLPHPFRSLDSLGIQGVDFVNEFLVREFRLLQRELDEAVPSVYLILGNDDLRFEEASIMSATAPRIWTYMHNRKVDLGEYVLYGYAFVPPTPFRNKDWERYDVSRYVDPGCISPEEGSVTVPVSPRELRYRTISTDLKELTGGDDLCNALFLFHVPPYDTVLDRADLEGQYIDYVPLDTHIGSIAVRRLIDERQPFATMHGHVHEAYRLTGHYRQQLGRTWCLSAAHEGPDLVVLDFDLREPGSAERRVVT
ncbi:MAG: metallophosphoesterase family protein, partial [Alkalispirochaetaceae bacterium]